MKWANDPSSNWCYKLAGFAGTGKTSMMPKTIENLKSPPFCCAPTAKAASVLKSKLPEGSIVTTIHKALYAPNSPCTDYIQELSEKLRADPENEELLAEKKMEEDRMSDIKLSFSRKLEKDELKGMTYIVDESPMVSRRMADDFRHSGAKVLFVGDTGQLPPVGSAMWFGSDGIDSMLSEPTRQALDSSIIRLSMDIREGRSNFRQYRGSGDVNICTKAELSNEQWDQADQVLTGSNRLRRKINRFFRKRLGFFGEIPMNGERLICLKNDMERGLINGVTAESIQDFFIDDFEQIRGSVLFENQVQDEIPFYGHPFEAHTNSKAEEIPWALRRNLSEFDWAYAITVHKSQGSEWPNVILADDGFWARQQSDRKRWLYTGITRAKEKLTWVKD